MTAADPITRLRAAANGGAPSSDFDLNPEFRPANRTLRPAAVLVAFQQAAEGPRLVLTKRASGLKHHPGQIAFPGGKLDPGDADAVDAALREAEEEVALPRHIVEVLGTMPAHETITGFNVTPVLGWIRDTFEPIPETGEVDEVFTVPFAHIADPANFMVESRFFRGTRRRFYVVPYGPYYIWGATARMLRALAEDLSR
ncbi:CoA pyrophosphatase [Sinisalibacter aestuarii]|uniref:Coenzyme A pyrophosphatase n=1 Tax=Sinisalibacter aestuarii TaxID=2949426 RepID=A0ABQ5LN86_9RHOB|nr:CoA pyrophosphatase [Sinisalibacter aestuarii]GKY86474.1 coenzyme A pyrophosphatase [Sinisalibacter aestuarii]